MLVKFKAVNPINFKKGLSRNLLIQEKNFDLNLAKDFFELNYSIETDFLENKASAFANYTCLGIFKQLNKIFKWEFNYPPAIWVYEKENLIEKESPTNFCIPDTKEVLKSDYPFAGRSIFFKNFKNLDFVNETTEKLFFNKISSSPHFLAPFIHEWLHSFQLDYIYKKFGYGGECDYLNNLYPNKNLSKSGVHLLKEFEQVSLNDAENEIIFDNLGEYSTRLPNQYFEVFCEAFTQLICDSLKGVQLVENPLKILKNKNPDYQKIVQKVCRFAR